MLQIKFKDSTLTSLSADRATWFTDPDVKRLRRCVTRGGVKTWWVNKWDSKPRKARAVKLGQWANKGMHCAWARKQMSAALLDIQEGKVHTKDERKVERMRLGIPTSAEALDRYIEHRTSARASGKAPMGGLAFRRGTSPGCTAPHVRHGNHNFHGPKAGHALPPKVDL